MNVEQPWHQNILTSRVKLIQTELIKVKSCQTCSFEYLERKRRVLQDLTASLYFRHLSSKMCASAFHPMSHFPGTLSNSVSLEQVQLQYLVLFVLLHHPP